MRKSKEADKEYNRRYYQEHMEQTRKSRDNSSRRWKHVHKAEWAAYMREYRRRKKEKGNAKAEEED